MTVKHVNESDLQKPKKVVIPSPEAELRVNSGDLLAGKNVPKKKVTTIKYVHSQILKIREEDSHLGEDFADLAELTSQRQDHHHNNSQVVTLRKSNQTDIIKDFVYGIPRRRCGLQLKNK
nr:hypothetical protein CFP56_29689 [Quercus suber]